MGSYHRFCDAKNRRSQARFECRECGWAAHADHNASRNIAALGHQKYWAAQSTVPKAATALTSSEIGEQQTWSFRAG
ncbi:zinc ribbon domain-containing protein [Rhodococcus qingshengii]|uniref:zinc ribbon domain-containing protein n=1 Tax=Rhodococcus qingshengii TaxID=334542 RepID=UPI003BAC9989